MKQFRNPETVHAPLAGYSHQVELSGNERLLVLSGQVGMRTDGTVPDDATEQFGVALENVERNLDAAGLTIRDLVKLTLYLVGQMDQERRRTVLTEKLAGHAPCMTLVYVAALAAPIYKVEIDAWASSDHAA
jgi:enamine deaminase RidA (YjgF/YER057c/UK114 family)